MKLITRLAGWDGKTTTVLKAVADDLAPSDHTALIAACHSDDQVTARAASWVLKAAYAGGADIQFPIDLLLQTPHWEVALHLLQSVQHVVVDVPATVIEPYLTHQKPIIRAWGLDAYVRSGAADATDVLAQAANDPAASVRARARNLQHEKAQLVPKLRPL